MRTIRPLPLCLLALLATPALAETRYDVEIVAFEQRSEADMIEERWRPAIVVPEFDRARRLGNGDGDGDTTTAGETIADSDALPADFERLANRDGRLRDALRRLESSSRYRVLRHLHWRQPALEPGESLPIRLRAGEPIAIETPRRHIERPTPAADNESIDEQLEEGEADVTGEDAVADTVAGESPEGDGAEDDGTAAIDAGGAAGGLMDPVMGPRASGTQRVTVHPLDGTIELVVSRYLHLHADLYFTRAVDREQTVAARGDERGSGDGGGTGEASDGADTAGAVQVARGPDGEAMLSFPFRQSRRMRSGELHYLDHPAIGLLVLVTPYEADEEDGEDAAEGNDEG